MNDRELMFLPAHEQRRMQIDRKISSVELVEASLRRVRELDPRLNAFITLDEDGALAAAREADARLAAGTDPAPLHGVPVSVKDLEVTAGLKTTLGCELFKDWVPDFDSTVVERVRRSGAVILGKTNTPEFGNREETYTSFFKACNNPWDVSRIPGGSSGGAAASVASGMCSIATGTDGGGSVRLPAGFCGIFGHKPTQGRIPRYGGRGNPAYNTTSTSGPMTRDVRDSAILLQALSGFDRRDPGSLQSTPPDYLSSLEHGVKGLRVGVSNSLGFAAVSDDVRVSIEEAAKAFEELGATVQDAELVMAPPPREYWWTVWTANQVAMYGELADKNPGRLMDYTLEMIQHGRTVTGAGYSKALRQAEAMRVQMRQFFSQYDLLLTPTFAATAWPHRTPPQRIGSKVNDGDFAGISYGAIPYTMAFNISWNPAASVPCGFGDNGMPVGLQVVADIDNDALVLQAARAFEQARPWKDLRPAVS
ncbi:MAG: amidase [Chloroflexi bacterium]|nr:amidase [Chloroflexota bacterium]